MALALVGSPEEPGPSRKDIAATLRAIADDIEAGVTPGIVEAVVVTHGQGGLFVYALGETDPAAAHLLLGAAQQKLQQSIL
jgi:hypothetical protein